MIYGYKSLKVYQLSFSLAMEIFELSKTFPETERYALTSQIRNSSRSVCANIAEAYRKRIYPKHFASKISDADAEASETMVWIDFSMQCGYINQSRNTLLQNKYREVGKMLGTMLQNPEKFKPKQSR